MSPRGTLTFFQFFKCAPKQRAPLQATFWARSTWTAVRWADCRQHHGGDERVHTTLDGRGISAAVLAAATVGLASLAHVSGQRSLHCDDEHVLPETMEDTLRDMVLSQRHLTHPTASNPTPTMMPPPIAGLSRHHLRTRLVTSIIGLPLRGKAHMARRLKLYLEFVHGFEVQIFDVNLYVGSDGDEKLLEDLRHFFDGDGMEDTDLHEKHVSSGRFAILVATNTYQAIRSMWSGHSKWRRRWMARTLEDELQAHISFVEIQVDDTSTHRKEYMDRLERSRGLPQGSLTTTVDKHSQHFVTIQPDGTEDDLTYMKLINYNAKVVTNNMMRSFIGSRVAQFLASVHPYHRAVYLTRHGESEYNVEKKIGGDSSLSPLGRRYARRLAEFGELVICKGAKSFAVHLVKPEEVDALLTNTTDSGVKGIFAKSSFGHVEEGMRLVRLQCGSEAEFQDSPKTIAEVKTTLKSVRGPFTLVFVDACGALPDAEQDCARLWTSSLRRTRDSAVHIKHPVIHLDGGKKWVQMSPRVYRNLDEVYAGDFEGCTYEEIKRRAPKEATLRKMDKLGYRYPRGESYYDVIARLDLPIHQLETSHEPLLIIGHQAVHRLVYAFLKGIPREEAIELKIPLHTVIKIEYDGTGSFQETRFFLGPTRLDDDDGQSLF